jgi:hypothetical protein
MWRIKLDKIWIGFVAGLLLPPLMLIGIHLYNYSEQSLGEFLVHSAKVGFIAPFLSICQVLNLAGFFLLYIGKFEMAPRGVIMGTFFWGLVIVYFKFLF